MDLMGGMAGPAFAGTRFIGFATFSPAPRLDG